MNEEQLVKEMTDKLAELKEKDPQQYLAFLEKFDAFLSDLDGDLSKLLSK